MKNKLPVISGICGLVLGATLSFGLQAADYEFHYDVDTDEDSGYIDVVGCDQSIYKVNETSELELESEIGVFLHKCADLKRVAFAREGQTIKFSLRDGECFYYSLKKSKWIPSYFDTNYCRKLKSSSD